MLKRSTISRIFVVLLIVAFFIIASAIAIILLQGRTIDDTGDIIQTSILRLNTIPLDVKAKINDKEVSIVDKKINWLEPGKVKLSLTKDGYRAWEKEITLEPGVVKDIYAQLLPDKVTFQRLSDTDVDNIFFALEPDFVFYTVLNSPSPSENGIWKLKLNRTLLDIGEIKPTQVAQFDTNLLSLITKSPYSLDISRDNQRLIFSIKDQDILYIYDANTNNSFIDFYKELGYMPETINWFRNSDALVIRKDKIVFEYELASKQMNIINYSEDGQSDFAIMRDRIIYKKDGQDTLLEYRNKATKILDLKINSISDIKGLYSQSDSEDIFIIKYSDSIELVDLKKNFRKVTPISGEIVNVGANARNMIVKAEDKLYSLTTEETIDTRGYLISLNALALDANKISEIYFSATGKNIIYVITENDLHNIWIMDNDGENAIKYLEDTTLGNTSTALSRNGSEMYALISNTTEETLENKKNIYKFQLLAN